MYLMDSAILWNFASFERFKRITKYNVYKRVNDMDYFLLSVSKSENNLCMVLNDCQVFNGWVKTLRMVNTHRHLFLIKKIIPRYYIWVIRKKKILNRAQGLCVMTNVTDTIQRALSLSMYKYMFIH